MYPSAQTMYQRNLQQNYYTGYQPVGYPQHYYYKNNNYYDNGYYNGSMSSSSSSMDSLNDPYYYSHPMATIPRVQGYQQIPSPEFVYIAHPVSPAYSPSRSPSYSPQPPTYSPQPPTYSPQSPTYSSISPSYPPTMPFMNSNSFNPVQPMNYMQTKEASPSKPQNNGKTEFHIGMKPAERLQWIRESFPKQLPSFTSTKKLSKSPWASAPVKPLRRPRISTIKS